jgi:glycosyltransferase involved in cell wall biosynthesis
MRVTIITACYNSSATIADTIKSVLAQSHPNIEYIIVDGQSSDNTLEIVKSFGNKISKTISEKDRGIYDALNKGIALATGEVIGILHADDFYADADVIKNVVAQFYATAADALYADLQYVNRTDINKVKRYWKSGAYKHGMFLNGWMPPHPTFFLRTKCYQKFGNYSMLFTTAADYELMLRMLHKHKITITYLPQVIVKMRTGGVSNVSIKNRIRANAEDKMAWQLNNLKPRFYTFLVKPLRKIFQFI